MTQELALALQALSVTGTAVLPSDAVVELLELRPRRRGAWSRRCPHCLSSALASAPRGALACVACKAVIPTPNPRAQAPSHATSTCHPCWDDDHRLQDGTWDRYSRRGLLVDAWGRSVDRHDGGPPPPGDEAEEMPPRVRNEATLGRADDELDKAIQEYLAHMDGLRHAADDLKPMLLHAHRGVFEPEEEALRPRARLTPRRAPELATTHVAHGINVELNGEVVATLTGEFTITEQLEDVDGYIGEPDVVPDVDAHLFKDRTEGAVVVPSEPEVDPKAAPEPRRTAWRPSHLVMGWRGLELGKLQALWILVVNALRARGVDYLGSSEQIRTRSRRAEPFAGVRHALAAAGHVSDHGDSSPIPRNAMAKFKLPMGPVFGQIACKPTRPSTANKGLPTDDIDIAHAIRDARVGARTYSEPGYVNPATGEVGVRRDPGRPLLDWEVELVRLVDVGEVHDKALAKTRKTKRGPTQDITRFAVEQLHPRDALAKLRKLGFEGVPRTEHEGRLALREARKAIRRVLEDRGLIPSIIGAVEPDAGEVSSPTRPKTKRRAPDAFAGVGAS